MAPVFLLSIRVGIKIDADGWIWWETVPSCAPNRNFLTNNHVQNDPSCCIDNTLGVAVIVVGVFADNYNNLYLPLDIVVVLVDNNLDHTGAETFVDVVDKFVLIGFFGSCLATSFCTLCESNFQEKVIDNVCEQSKYFEQLKSEVTDEKVVIQVDFAENFGSKEPDEIQSAHWDTKTLSIFTAYVWSKSQGFSFRLPSNDVSHDKFVVNSAIEIILNELKTHVPNLKQIDFFSDGAASQFKQRFMFRNLIQIAHEYKIALSWNFFATSHGKGVVDGLGGTVKRLVWSAALAGNNCKSAKDFVKLAQQKTKKIIIIEITKNGIDNSKLKLENIFKVAKSVPETLKTHSVKRLFVNTCCVSVFLMLEADEKCLTWKKKMVQPLVRGVLRMFHPTIISSLKTSTFVRKKEVTASR
ncbi:unnamed protein product [Didymodactylos carnosus]|uniref:Uncharacterized protein n=1 Tax=Didymodactylos carnosus TaxID=1234261 RepID=A0A8S2N563_9BILA|nr:unnamed protein product [Didymodactylos carnosus]CAF3990425.1 unnamed protein product [Didymodactylos carnosus]